MFGISVFPSYFRELSVYLIASDCSSAGPISETLKYRALLQFMPNKSSIHRGWTLALLAFDS